MTFHAFNADCRFRNGPPTFRREAISRSFSKAEFEMLSPGVPLRGPRRVIAVGPVLVYPGVFRQPSDLRRRTR